MRGGRGLAHDFADGSNVLDVAMGERKGACRVLLGKRVGKGLLGRCRRRWEHNIRMGFQELG